MNYNEYNVGIGGEPQSNNSIKRNDLMYILYASIFIIILVTIFIIVITYQMFNNATAIYPQTITNTPTTTALNLSTNWGASIYKDYPINLRVQGFKDGSALSTQNSCSNYDNTYWNGQECKCIEPFFGAYCTRERHDKKYFAVGNSNGTIKYNPIKKVKSQNKSFNNNTDNELSCSWYCDNTDDCTGFIYQNNICILLEGEIEATRQNSLMYDHHVDPTIYIKNLNNVKISNAIGLAKSSDLMPNRWWLDKDNKYFKRFIPKMITEISFFPTAHKINGDYTGIYSLIKFNYDDIDTLLKRGHTATTYIHEAGNTLNLPASWKYVDKIYVIYV